LRQTRRLASDRQPQPDRQATSERPGARPDTYLNAVGRRRLGTALPDSSFGDLGGYKQSDADCIDCAGRRQSAQPVLHASRHKERDRGCPPRRDPAAAAARQRFSELRGSEDDNYDNSFVGFFANRGFDVWGYSQRVQGIVAGSCESGAIDCSPMADWGMQTIVNDVAFIRQQIGLEHPGQKPVVGGLSLGSIVSVAVINAAPDDYAGALLIEGTLYDADPQVRAINQGFCDMFDGLLAQGVYYDGQQLPAFKLVAQLATVAPNAPSPLPGFPPGFTNHQAFVAFLSASNISPITPRPNYFLAAGDAQQDRLFFVNDALTRANIAQFVDYVAVRTIRDVNCGLAGDRTFTNNLQNFKGAVYVVAGGHGFGTGMLDTAALMTSASKTINFTEAFGHVDAYFEGSHRQNLDQPILAWLERVVSRP